MYSYDPDLQTIKYTICIYDIHKIAEYFEQVNYIEVQLYLRYESSRRFRMMKC